MDAQKRVYQQAEKEKAQDITKLQQRVELEKRVYDETEAFLKRKNEELQHKTEHWDNKYEQDMEEKVRQLEALKSKKASDLMKLTDLKQKFKEVQELVSKEKRLMEAKSYAQDIQRKRTEVQYNTILKHIRPQRGYKELGESTRNVSCAQYFFLTILVNTAKDKLKKLKKAAKKKKKTGPNTKDEPKIQR